MQQGDRVKKTKEEGTTEGDGGVLASIKCCRHSEDKLKEDLEANLHKGQEPGCRVATEGHTVLLTKS